MSGIYIHIPFCKQACHYCDFHFSTSLKKKDEMLSCLVQEIGMRKDELEDELVETIYLGGGTPSVLKSNEIHQILDAVYANFKVTEDPEITLEANPDDLTQERIQELANSQVNRLSIGIQSFFEEDLQMMNRAHNADEAKLCLKEATKYFDNITIDLIYGIPNMSVDMWKQNIHTALDFGISHISSYALTVEPKTALDSFIQKGTYPPLDEQLAKEHFDVLINELNDNGFVHYEISNFGKPNYFSKHNTSYWKGKKYLGIGPSAHSFSGNKRSWNVANNSIYIKSIQQEKLPLESEVLTKEDQYNEYVMTGLRTIWGVSLDSIDEKFKEKLLQTAQKFIDEDLLEITDNKLKTTPKGKFLADGLASELFII